MKNILLLTDFSDNAQTAITYALQLFMGGKHNFFILNVQKSSGYALENLMTSPSTSTVYDAIIKNPKEKLSQMTEGLKKTYKNENYTFDFLCDFDNFISSVKQTIKIKNIDMIVMGTNGATGASEKIFGSNTLSIIRNIKKPVLVIPDKYQYKKPNSVLFVTEHNEKFIPNVVTPLTTIISKFDAELMILTLDKKPSSEALREKKEAISTYFKGIEHSFYDITNIPAEIAIDSFMQIKHIDLTAKIINKESFLKRIISGSSIDDITYKTKVPLFIMHP